MEDKEQLIKAIERTLKGKKMSLAQLGEKMTGRPKLSKDKKTVIEESKIGISQASVSQTIHGNPTLDKLVEISNILGCTVPELLSGGKLPTDIPQEVTLKFNGKDYIYTLKE